MKKEDLKFRAWLYIDGTMQYESIFGAEKFGGRDCEIMQYTGLKDKNGKEIYEGDIIVTRLNSPDNNEESLVVEFADGSFKLKKENTYYYFPFLLNVEVIGNIYENPELLNHA